MAEILPIRRKTLSNQSINQSINQTTGTFDFGLHGFIRMIRDIHACCRAIRSGTATICFRDLGLLSLTPSSCMRSDRLNNVFSAQSKTLH